MAGAVPTQGEALVKAHQVAAHYPNHRVWDVRACYICCERRS